MTKIDIISGFLGAGKTTLIKRLLADALKGEQVVLIENEFGEIGIDGGFLKDAGIVVNEMNAGCICCSLVGDFGKALHDVVDQYHPDRILIEPSGVGKLSDVIAAVQNAHLDVQLNSFVTVVDALKEMLYKKNIKAMNPRAAIYLDDLNGNSEDYSRNMPLPFDIDADIIDIKPEDYGLWYIDATGEPEKYDGKTVRFLAQVYRGKDVPAGSFVPGRFGMVCCADDVTFLGFICRYDKAEDLGVRDWVTVTASVTVETLPQYRGEGPVLHAIEVVPAEKAKEDIVYFN